MAVVVCLINEVGIPGGRVGRLGAFEELQQIKLRVAAALTPSEVGVCSFVTLHTNVSRTSRLEKRALST
uniref:Uncharacterized protein n=1 Tax=Vespula pensylvanica TaxID=30213 RepID=A0A834UBA0_VESPE|nr:hypothetical protein H0235_007153 [Vespula pensylvanica]